MSVSSYLGTDDDPVRSSRIRPSHRGIDLSESRLCERARNVQIRSVDRVSGLTQLVCEGEEPGCLTLCVMEEQHLSHLAPFLHAADASATAPFR